MIAKLMSRTSLVVAAAVAVDDEAADSRRIACCRCGVFTAGAAAARSAGATAATTPVVPLPLASVEDICRCWNFSIAVGGIIGVRNAAMDKFACPLKVRGRAPTADRRSIIFELRADC